MRVAGLLAFGPVRVKLATGIAGLGQFVVANARDLARALEAIDAEELARFGAVVEQNLTDVTTYSVGQVRVADIVATYYGTQHLTTNNRGAGDLRRIGTDRSARRLRRVAGLDACPRTFALRSRRHASTTTQRVNASRVCLRRDATTMWRKVSMQRVVRRSGVLEQSWRLGGASGAEIGALEAFRADPSLRAVRAMTREVYGDSARVAGECHSLFFRQRSPRWTPDQIRMDGIP